MRQKNFFYWITCSALILLLFSGYPVFAIEQKSEGGPSPFKAPKGENQAVTAQEIELSNESACLTYSPSNIIKYQEPNVSDSAGLTIANTCEVPVDFSITQRAVILWEDFEGFELGYIDQYNGWEAEQGANGQTVNRWEIKNDPQLVYEGDQYAWVGYDDNLPSDEWLWTPEINISELTAPYLSFFTLTTTGYPGATMEVWVTDRAGNNLTASPIWDLIRDETWTSKIYRSVFLDLSTFAGNSPIRIAWHYVGQAGNSFALDAVEVGGAQVPWLSATPTSGTISAKSNDVITMTFDSTGLSLLAPYYATLFVEDASLNVARIPITFIVGYLNYFPFISK